MMVLKLPCLFDYVAQVTTFKNIYKIKKKGNVAIAYNSPTWSVSGIFEF